MISYHAIWAQKYKKILIYAKKNVPLQRKNEKNTFYHIALSLFAGFCAPPL